MKKIIFFYEAHSDISASLCLSKLRQYLKDFGITKIAIESPSGENYILNEEMEEKYKADQQLYNDLIEKRKFAKNDREYYDEILPKLKQIPLLKLPSEDEVNEIDINGELGVAIQDNLKIIRKISKVEYDSLKIIKDLSKDFGTFAMDLPNTEKTTSWQDSNTEHKYNTREKYMIESIKSQFDNTEDGILVLVGSSHHKMSDFFKQNENYSTYEIFFDHKGPNSADPFDNQRLQELRAKDNDDNFINVNSSIVKSEKMNDPVIGKIIDKIADSFTEKVKNLLGKDFIAEPDDNIAPQQHNDILPNANDEDLDLSGENDSHNNDYIDHN